MTGSGAMDDPVNLHDQELVYPEHRQIEHVRENETHRQKVDDSESIPYQLPVLALNEVFIGESLSARYEKFQSTQFFLCKIIRSFEPGADRE